MGNVIAGTAQQMNALQNDMGAQNAAFKRIRESRQKGNKSTALPTSAIVEQQNQMMQAYINQVHPYSKQQMDMQQTQIHNRHQEPGRIRAHSDMKKGQVAMGLKSQGNPQVGNNSRDQLNQTTVLNGASGMQQFHSRGNSVSSNAIPMGLTNPNQKRSQSVDRNAPSFQFNQQHMQQHPQQLSAPQKGNGSSQHFIHEAIERKIERFSRQRNRGGLILGSSTNAAQAVYSQHLVNNFNGNAPAPGQPGARQQMQEQRNFKGNPKNANDPNP